MERLCYLATHGAGSLGFAVVDPTNTVVSLHQHPDAAERFLATCARTDLRVVELY